MSKCRWTSSFWSARNVQFAPVEILSLYVSCRSLGGMLTSSVNATAHHWWNCSSSWWCWRSRGQCSPRLRCRTIALSPCSSDRRCMSPWSSGRSKLGIVVPGSRFLLMRVSLRVSARTHAGDAQPHSVDACQGGDVERAAVRVAPGQVVRILGQLDQPELLAPGRQDPDAAGTADVEVAVAVDLDAVDGVLARRVGHVVEDLAAADGVAVGVDLVAHHDLALDVPVADVEVALVGREREPVRAAELVGDERHGAVACFEDAAERQLLGGVVEGVGQPERRV